jgi:hypothetical protein
MGVQSVIAHARARWVDGRNVLAIGRGPKRVGDARLETPAVIFYVRRKGPEHFDAATRIPRWLLDRDAAGRVDRSRRWATDVREVGAAVAVSSGQQCRSVSEKGTASLAFDVGRGRARRVYVLTCAHVIGDVHREVPGFRRISLELPGRGRARGSRLHHRVERNGRLDYDLAIGELVENAARVPLREVSRPGQALTAFLRSAIGGGRPVRVLGRRTLRVKDGTVIGPIHTPFPVRYRGGELGVRHLYELEGFTPRSGDSGGLVYHRERAVGVVVARLSRGGCLFHPLYAATRRLLNDSTLAFGVDDIF